MNYLHGRFEKILTTPTWNYKEGKTSYVTCSLMSILNQYVVHSILSRLKTRPWIKHAYVNICQCDCITIFVIHLALHWPIVVYFYLLLFEELSHWRPQHIFIYLFICMVQKFINWYMFGMFTLRKYTIPFAFLQIVLCFTHCHVLMM